MPVTDQHPPPVPESDTLLENAPDRRLVELYSPCFVHVLEMQETDALGETEALRRQIYDLLDQCEEAAKEAGISSEDIEEAKFALVAFIDETILSSDWAGTDEWMKTPIQLELYDQFDAGEVFFERLEELREDPAYNAEVLEVYYLCMTLGFKGKYQLQKQEKFREIIESTADLLADLPETSTEEMAPHARPQDQTETEIRSKVPTWVIAAIAALLGVLLYGGMHLYISASARGVATTIQSLSGG